MPLHVRRTGERVHASGRDSGNMPQKTVRDSATRQLRRLFPRVSDAAPCAQEGKVAKPDKLLDDSDSEEEVADVEFQVCGAVLPHPRRSGCSELCGIAPAVLSQTTGLHHLT